MAQPEDDVYTVAVLAKRLKVDRKQIYRLIQAGRLAAIRLGPRLYRIPSAAAHALLCAGVIEAEPGAGPAGEEVGS